MAVIIQPPDLNESQESFLGFMAMEMEMLASQKEGRPPRPMQEVLGITKRNELLENRRHKYLFDVVSAIIADPAQAALYVIDPGTGTVKPKP